MSSYARATAIFVLLIAVGFGLSIAVLDLLAAATRALPW